MRKAMPACAARRDGRDATHSGSHTALDHRPPRQYFEQAACARPLGALPPNPRDLTPLADPVGAKNKKKDGPELHSTAHPTVFGPDPALGSLPSVALSSGQALDSLSPQSQTVKKVKPTTEILSLQMAKKWGHETLLPPMPTCLHRGRSVTYVPGIMCYLCARSHILVFSPGGVASR